MKKKFVIAFYVVLFAYGWWFISSTAEVVIHNGNPAYVYSKNNMWELIETETKTCHVTDCEKSDDCWLVTVETADGNLWCYYDTEPKAKWDVLHVRFKGKEIVDVWDDTAE